MLIILLIIYFINSFGYIIFIGGITQEKIKERTNNIKQLLYLSGGNLWSYWIGFIIIDFLKLIIFNLTFSFSLYFLYEYKIYYYWLALIPFCISFLIFIYFISLFCSKEDSVTKFLFLYINSFIIIFVIIKIFPIFYSSEKYSNYYKNILLGKYNFTFLDLNPITSFCLSLWRLLMWKVSIDKDGEGKSQNLSYLYTSILNQFINFILYGSLFLLTESGYLLKLIYKIKKIDFSKKTFNSIEIEKNSEAYFEIWNNENKDSSLSLININDKNENNQKNEKNLSFIKLINYYSNLYINPLDNPFIINEKNKVENSGDFSTKIIGVNKTISFCGKKNQKIINNLYLKLENEKFGLLGFNGAGKTATFKAITNEILIDNGKIQIFGLDNKKDFNKLRARIGYCPQINPLFDFLKVNEIIKFYLQLKTCNETVNSICEKYDLYHISNSYCANLSDGDKRKLTLAIALMNKPDLLLLDEPSTGVDPISRRIMWKNINELFNDKHQYNMILTTHSMEEAFILCDRISWLNSGNFIYLKNKDELILKNFEYKLYIKFNEDSFSSISDDNINELFKTISNLVEGFDKFSKYIFNKSNLGKFLKQLIDIINKIKSYTLKIKLDSMKDDLSLEILLEIDKNQQKYLFNELINMKENDNQISEILFSLSDFQNF